MDKPHLDLLSARFKNQFLKKMDTCKYMYEVEVDGILIKFEKQWWIVVNLIRSMTF